MSDLLDNILNENYVSANEIFEERLGEILEKKLYEKKKMIQAEAFGGMTKQDIERRKKAGFMRASVYFNALNTAKEIERKAKGDIEPKKKKKKVEEAYTGTGSGSDKELEARAKGAAGRLGQAMKGAAKATSERISREQAKRAAKKKRASTEPGKPYVAPSKAEPKTVKTPSVELPPEDVRRKAKVAREKSRVFSSGEIERARKAPPDRETAYQHDKEVAHALRRDNHPDAMSRFKKEYSGYETGKKIKSFAKGVWNALGEDTE